LLAIAAIFIFIYVLRHPSDPTTPIAVPSGASASPSPSSESPSPTAEETPEPTPTVEPSPTEPPTPTPEPARFIDGFGRDVLDFDYGQPVPEAEPVGDDFFTDTAFIGNSLTEGFMLYSGLTGVDGFAAKSVSVRNIETVHVVFNGDVINLMDALALKQYGKIFIFLGINEISMKIAEIHDAYGQVIDDIQALQPDASIYIQAITPVTAAAAKDKGAIFNNDRIREINAQLLLLSWEKKCFYIDTFEAFADERGNLPAIASFDGVHLTANYYKTWLAYLKSHAIDKTDYGRKADLQ
jgi:lysophospholipase L1-like esterase